MEEGKEEGGGGGGGGGGGREKDDGEERRERERWRGEWEGEKVWCSSLPSMERRCFDPL